MLRLADIAATLRSETARDNLADIWQGLRLTRLWLTVAWLETKQRYRRSVLGSLWITISLGVMIGGMGFVFATLFGQNPRDYLPYLGVSLVGWNLISTLINEGSELFINSRTIMLQYNMPTSVHLFKFISKVLISFAHNSIIIIALMIIFDVTFQWSTLLVFLAILLILVNGLWVALVLGFMSLKFRDLPFIVSSIVQVMFFMTPVMWRAEDLGDRTFVYDFNPFYHFLEIFRSSILGGAPEMTSLWVVITMSGLGSALGLFVWAYRRHRIYYYL